MSKESCNNIKGVFILMIFLSHSLQYIKESGFFFSGIDILTSIIVGYIGQLVVVMFLFYSGYGVAIQIECRGKMYVRQMPRQRILKTLLNFDIAVCLFIILNLLLMRPLSFGQVLLSFVAWDSVGNSNWYIFVIITCYILTYLAFCVNKNYTGEVILVLCLIAMIILSRVKELWWYDTILAYPAGYIFAMYRQHIEKYIKQYYYPCLVVFAAIFFITHGYCPSTLGLAPNVMAIVFALIIVMITMKIHIGNRWLQWFGANLFPLYIYQRIPMIALLALLGNEFVSTYPIAYLVVCLITTCIIAKKFKYWNVR